MNLCESDLILMGYKRRQDPQKRGPKKNTIVEVQYKNLHVRADGADAMDSVFEQGYDSDGEIDQYLEMDHASQLQEIEEACDVHIASKPDEGGGALAINNFPD